MTESQARLVDSLCKIVATIALVIGGGWTLYTYFNARAAEARTAAIEARKPFLAKRLEIYSQAADISSETALRLTEFQGAQAEVNSPTPHVSRKSAEEASDKYFKQYRDAEDRFVGLAHGPLPLVEDKKVEQAVARLEQCFEDQCSVNQFFEESERIAHACRDSLGEEWQVNVSNSPVTKENLEKLRH